MNCSEAQEVFPELLDPRTPATAHLDVRTHLAHCPECQREFAALHRTLAALDTLPAPPPSTRLRQSFYAMLAEEKQTAARGTDANVLRRPPARKPWLRWVISPLAAVGLLALGFVGGTRFAAPEATTAPVPAPADAEAHRKIAELERKLDTMGQLVGYSLLQQQQRPANDRLRGVLSSASSASENPDDRVIDELISALALDPNANVRLRAVEALFPHADQEVVRAGILASLPREQNPLVQVSMIDFLVAARDLEARPALEKLTLNQNTDGSVREAARRALAQF